ncbi:biotin carboxyl carrier protein of acetyl-CoA carboxylase 1, chloroplastic-like [Zingiber officinale]|uniref:biotin carboxyl carrier protein of acetyl-CoA carboxylase 1, chloroplastic-like n=1 Tax=Zingiber officinale TaxID=94328 RepID=UPI001C4C2D72|nr:biotin carboxyl carrier protein of acetyl-CoA carboxylase 1, chloroplastic-like [Zingiber officinale]
MVASASPAAAATATGVSAAAVSASSASHRRPASVSFSLPSKLQKPLLFHAKGLGFRRDNAVAVKAQLNDDVGGSANNSASSGTKADSSALKGKNVRNENVSPPSAPLTEEAIAEFMTQVASLVELVDSRDIVELQLKQNDCEVIIRKKEALPQPPPSQVVMMQTPASPLPVSQAIPQPSPAPALPSPASPAPPASAPASTPKALKTSHPPLKSPMSGTLYRSPGPGLPPFVKPGDKVSKGQVLCIIEAMKLMNEIESDQAGTVVEILIEDGKPVGVGQPIFVIEP